jgi:hypothetical protein
MRSPAIVVLVLAVCLAAAGPATAGTLVRYDRTGGFAGLNDHVTVTTGGRVTVTQRSGEDRFTLSERRLGSLRKAVHRARFGSLRPAYGADTAVADGITETVRHGGHKVVVETGGDPPARLERLLDRLARMLSDR